METVVGKVIGVIFAIIALFYISINNYVCLNEITSRRALVNETTNFINKVTDTGVCDEDMLEDFYLGCSSHGEIVDVTARRYESVVNPISSNTSGGTKVTYIINSDINEFNQGDVLQVEIKFASDTGMKVLLWKTLHLFNPRLDFFFAGMVRH